MDNVTVFKNESKNWLDKPLISKITLNTQTTIFLLIISIAIFSRLYILGARVMSHDEINHVYFAYTFYKGGEYVHNPMTHGPLQFHLLELSYFLFNVSDFSARIPAAFFSMITILFMWKFNRYLGRSGSIAAAALLTISPFMLYYGRYARNEAIAIFFTISTVWAVLRFLDSGENKYLYITAGLTALHFSTKETAFIFTAQLMIFLGLLFLYRISKLPWNKPGLRNIFFVLLLISAILLFATQLFPNTSDQVVSEGDTPLPVPDYNIATFGFAGISFFAACILLIAGYGWTNLKSERSFGMLLFQLTLVFPQLAAFPAFWMKLPLTEYTNIDVVGQVSKIMAVFFVISIAAGGAWKPREWLIGAGIYYGIFILLYTSIFSNLGGIYSGLIGSLGYWLEQHGLERGNQPWYYFILTQLPLYEYLALLGTFVTCVYTSIWAIKRSSTEKFHKMLLENEQTNLLSEDNSKRIGLAMLIFFSLTSILAYSIVGEKMPWLTVHISWSMWLATGWLFGKLIDKLDWHLIFTARGLIAFSAISTVIVTIAYAGIMWIKPIHPFSGTEISELEITGTFLFIILIFICSTIIYIKATNTWGSRYTFIFGLFSLLALSSIFTIRHATLASYVNYDEANEYLVYAHAARGPKDALDQIESISLRLTGGKDLKVGFDNHTAYPFWWYLRDYPNRLEYGENPTRDLRNYSIILTGDANYQLLDPIVQDDYVQFDYLRMVWPNQDYFDLGYFKNYLSNPETRNAMLYAFFQIWLNRNYEPYGEVTQKDMSLRRWNPSQSFRMYIRKDVAAQIWQFGAATGSVDINADPYASGKIDLKPLTTLSNLGLNNPKGLAVAPDGSIFIADTGNNRILHISSENSIINQWGSSGSEAGQFNQPWDVAIDQSGIVYITDTWNHRIQKFTQQGEFIAAWGVYGQAESPIAFWGPRGITVDTLGNVLVTDTGNKRVVIFSQDGEFIQEFGSVGYQPGEFDEPVGIASSPVKAMIFVADTWNQRVQSFEYIQDFGYAPINSWNIDGWYGQSLDNKPLIAADTLNRVIVTDPEAGRILVFSYDGTFLNTFGDYDLLGSSGFGVIGGIAADAFGGVWVTDSLKNELKYYIIP